MMVIGSSSPTHAIPRLERRGKVISLAFFNSDDELVSGLRSGRADAQAEIFRRFEMRVATLLHRLIGAHYQLPELVEEVFEQAFVEAKTLRGSSGVLEPWLVRLAVARARAFLLRRAFLRWWPRRRTDVPPRRLIVGSANTAQAELMVRFYALVDRMPISQRVPFLLELIDGMSVCEIAEACASSTAQVKRRLHRARARFSLLAAGDLVLRAAIGGGSVGGEG